MKEVRTVLFEYADEAYALFQAKLIPTISRESIIGVKVPTLRKIARSIDGKRFLQDLPHNYYDENMLHSILLSNEKDFDECVLQIERFLPYIDNWAVCDTLHPQVFAKHSKEVLTYADKWIKDTHTYTIRFGIKAFMTELLDGDFKEEYLETVANVKNDDYYVKMAVAWYFATALAKQWDSAVKLLQNGRLDAWTHNKAIQKARESFRITKAQKEYLNTLKK